MNEKNIYFYFQLTNFINVIKNELKIDFEVEYYSSILRNTYLFGFKVQIVFEERFVFFKK